MKRPAMGRSACRFKFADWPLPFVSDEGRIDAAIVLGISEAPGKKKQSIEPFLVLHEFIGRLQLESEKRSAGKRMDSPCVTLDTRISNKLKQQSNLICIGAGDTNLLTREILSAYWKDLPLRFNAPNGSDFIEHLQTGAVWDENESGRDAGLILLLPNPYSANRVAVIAAGNHYTGTQAAILALARNMTSFLYEPRTARRIFDSPAQVNSESSPREVRGFLKLVIPENKRYYYRLKSVVCSPCIRQLGDASLVKGLDADRDGRVDEVEILI